MFIVVIVRGRIMHVLIGSWLVSKVFGISRGRGGSAIRTAVASTVLGNTNDPGTFEENTARVVAPLSPDTRDVTSAATVGFFKLE